MCITDMLSDDQINRPVVALIEDSGKYVEILRGVLTFVDYLSGKPHPRLQTCYDSGNWMPAMSKVRYGLLCIALNTPEFEPHYHSFCIAVGDRFLNLTYFAEKTQFAR